MPKPRSSPSPWLTVDEARRVAKCGKKLLYGEIAAGRLRAARLGARRDIRIHETWINDWLERLAKPTEIN
jgi:excisionase family DNA binding protein